MRRMIFWVMIPIFLAMSLPVTVLAQDEQRHFSPSEREIVPYAGVPYGYKTKEQVAFELFLSALKNVQELHSIGTYDAYLRTFEESLNAVYGMEAPAIRILAAPEIIEKWKGLSPNRREAISKKLEQLITESK